MGNVRTAARKKAEIKIYLPENLDPSTLSPDAQYFCHLVYRQRIYRDYHYKHEAFIPLKMDYLRKQMAQTSVRLSIQDLIDRCIIECDGHWRVGYKSRGYRFTSAYRYQPHREHRLSHEPLLRRLAKWHQQEHADYADHHHRLLAMLQMVSIDTENAIAAAQAEYNQTIQSLRGLTSGSAKRKRRQAKFRLSAARYGIEKLATGDYFLWPDRFGRVHTNLTNMPSCLRPYLMIGNQYLVEVDLCNSQPLLLGLIARAKNLVPKDDLDQEKSPTASQVPSTSHYDVDFEVPRDLARWLRLCEEGRFYRHVCRRLHLGHVGKAKGKFFHLAFGQKKHNPLATVFPTVWATVAAIKKKDHRHLAHALQRLESRAIIRLVSQDLHDKGVLHSTVHDSILCLPHDVPAIQETIQQVFALEFNTRVSLKVKGQ